MPQIPRYGLVWLLATALVFVGAPAHADDPPDPVSCAEMLVDPDLRGDAWQNATRYREWAGDAAVWTIKEVNDTLAALLLPPPDDDNETGNETGGDDADDRFIPPPPSPPAPSAIYNRSEDAVRHSAENLDPAEECLDESLGISDTAGPAAEALGGVVGTVRSFLEPHGDTLLGLVSGAECTLWQTLGESPAGCEDGEAP